MMRTQFKVLLFLSISVLYTIAYSQEQSQELMLIAGSLGVSNIYVSDGKTLTDATPFRVLEGHTATSFSMSPSGNHIAFSSYLVKEESTFSNIYLYSTETDELEQITFGYGEEKPKWSPDGSKIAYISDSLAGVGSISVFNTQDRMNLKIVGSRYQLNDRIEIGYITSFTWSPDSNFLALAITVTGSEGYGTIFLYNLSEKSLIEIFSTKNVGSSPLWSNDSNVLYYICQNNTLCSINITSQQTNVVDRLASISDSIILLQDISLDNKLLIKAGSSSLFIYDLNLATLEKFPLLQTGELYLGNAEWIPKLISP